METDLNKNHEYKIYPRDNYSHPKDLKTTTP